MKKISLYFLNQPFCPGCPQSVKKIEPDLILYLVTLPLMMIIVGVAFIDFVPNLIHNFATTLHWILP